MADRRRRQGPPDVIWLAEAFTKPAMMHTLGKVGFQQSYTYYAWRNSAQELQEYVEEFAGDAAAYMRPSFWPTTRHPHALHAVRRRARHGSCPCPALAATPSCRLRDLHPATS